MATNARKEFDPSLDRLVDVLEIAAERDRERIVVSVMCYNGGADKIDLRRQYESRGQWLPTKLGRFTFDEAERVIAAIANLVKRKR